MKTIADTNIWYYLGQAPKLFEKIKDMPIVPTFVNIYELSKSHNILDKEELSRAAIQKMFAYKKHVIYEPPFVYISKLHNTFEFDPVKEIGTWLKFTEKFAKGHSIAEDKKEDFKKEIEQIRANLDFGANLFNTEAEEIRKRIKNKKEHKKKDTHQVTGGFLNFCVETISNKKHNLEGFDLNKIELLVKTLDHFFKTLETSKMKIQANDWYDFVILAYVQPGDKYWTKEKRWNRLISEAGCEEYLYEK